MIDEATIIANQYAAQQRGLLSIWTIYDHPRDYPQGFIARRFEVGGGRDAPIPTTDILTGELENLRDALSNAGLTRLDRHAQDEQQIVECWI